METQSEPSELELDDVVITNPHIEAILENEDWIEDASYVFWVTLWNYLHSEFVWICCFSVTDEVFSSNSGLVSHCISILKVTEIWNFSFSFQFIYLCLTLDEVDISNFLTLIASGRFFYVFEGFLNWEDVSWLTLV